MTKNEEDFGSALFLHTAEDFNAVPKKFFLRKMLIQDDSSCPVLLLCTFIEISKSVNVKITKILEIFKLAEARKSEIFTASVNKTIFMLLTIFSCQSTVQNSISDLEFRNFWDGQTKIQWHFKSNWSKITPLLVIQFLV